MIGIMIMLRVKISQQAVLTIQSAIPKLITSLILVTFSYAIVGLLIDLSYVVESLGVSLIISASGKAGTVADIIKNPDVMGRITGLFPMLTLLYLSLVVAGIVAVISAITGTMGILGAVALAAIWLVIGIMILWYTIKFFLGLVKCYVSIILKTVVAPLEIAMGAIPNMKMGFGSWFVDIIANILVFPISIIFLVLLDALITATSGKVLWSPPGIDVLNNLTAGSGGILPVALGLGGLMLIAKLPKMIPEFIFQIKPSPWGKAIGEGFAPIGGFFGKTAKGGAEYGVQSAGKGMSDKWGDADKGWRKAAKQIGQGIQFFKR
jgi:hypothetical protein